MVEPSEAEIKEAYQHAPIQVVKIDIARADSKDAFGFKRDGNWLIMDASEFPRWIAEDLENMEDEDSYVIQTGTMIRAPKRMFYKWGA